MAKLKIENLIESIDLDRAALAKIQGGMRSQLRAAYAPELSTSNDRSAKSPEFSYKSMLLNNRF